MEFNIGFINYLNDNIEAQYFLDLISNLDIEISKNINLYIANCASFDFSSIKNKFKNIYEFDNYKTSNFQKIIKNINLGIVPSLLKNTISLSTVEFLKNDVPIISSKIGEDQELCTLEIFKFEDEKEFKEKFQKIFKERELLKEYKKNYSNVTKQFIEETVALERLDG